MHVFINPTNRFLSCLVCSGIWFSRRDIKMNTSGMSFAGLDWLNKSADGAICLSCGFVHSFFAQNHSWVLPQDVRPGDLPPDPYGPPEGSGK